MRSKEGQQKKPGVKNSRKNIFIRQAVSSGSSNKPQAGQKVVIPGNQ
jgi:hypothetical protein